MAAVIFSMSTGLLEFSAHAVTGWPKIQSRHHLGRQKRGEFADISPPIICAYHILFCSGNFVLNI